MAHSGTAGASMAAHPYWGTLERTKDRLADLRSQLTVGDLEVLFAHGSG